MIGKRMVDMKRETLCLNRYHKEVLSVALEIFEMNGDDTWLDIRDNPNTLKAYNQLVEVCKPPKLKKINEPKIPSDAIRMGNLTSKDIL
jgi:hypothetical protein